MRSKKILIIAFVVVVVVQLLVPLTMILKHEDVLQTGKIYKFKTAPIDPNDPFRGKYITLNFDRALTIYASNENFDGQKPAFVLLDKDTEGFAKIKAVLKQEPENQSDYVRAKAYKPYGANENRIRITYPFDRFYMEECKAPDAEKIYRQSAGEPDKKPAYALVAVKNGNAVLKDVIIDGRSVKDITNRP